MDLCTIVEFHLVVHEEGRVGPMESSYESPGSWLAGLPELFPRRDEVGKEINTYTINW